MLEDILYLQWCVSFIHFISAGNFFVTEEKRGRSTYYVANKFGIENITCTPSELISLHFIKELLKSRESYIGLEKHLDQEIINTVRKGIELNKK